MGYLLVPDLNCGANDQVLVTKICGQEVSTSRRLLSGQDVTGVSLRRLSSDSDAYFTLILNAVESDLRAQDSLIGQYLQGSNLNSILVAIQNEIVSSTSMQTLSSVTALYYTFVASMIRGLGLFYPNWGISETCVDDGNQPGKSKRVLKYCLSTNSCSNLLARTFSSF